MGFAAMLADKYILISVFDIQQRFQLPSFQSILCLPSTLVMLLGFSSGLDPIMPAQQQALFAGGIFKPGISTSIHITGVFVIDMKHFLVLFLFITSQVIAQTPKLYNHTSNDVHVIHSEVLNQDRRIYIHVPKLDSADINKALSVMYLLDGENHFHILSAYIEYLRHWQVIPPIIVVGIVSVDRVKDLTPTNSLIDFDGKDDSKYKTSGGNEQFLTFIHQELMPYMEANYKTSPFKIFAGHSFGGLTAINCMLTRPDMFDVYIAISPSLWFGNKYILRLAEQRLPGLRMSNKKFFYSVGNEGGAFRGDLLKFDKLLNHARLKTIEHKYKYYPSEDHMTEPIPAYYDALRFVYKDWKYDKAK
ncbi:alpha/beta hydrolase [Segetibacter sp. 3557_3]|uniref:alpha/beta hydrolase n=1 Tax=Segetibacter sp. 3557_3 TaxID=2547429 RepID=UPI00105906E4|nr:alpha/beta hydrolase-fold protein [Segetibacter sp. 3557_3]TDH26927.1 alpha/beta hydrolase [Segetibacter sp. 3557_3]